jgi:3-hydroxyisobutyrate dehydrogenase-like beta-hydroxyacid dehydrogenase
VSDPAASGSATLGSARGTIGFAGLGSMGTGIARRLLAAGNPVVGWNRTPARAEALVADGLQIAASPAELGRRATVIFTSLTDANAVRAVCEGPNGLLGTLGPEHIYLDLSTIEPAESRELARRVAATGARMLDAPVSGSPATVAAGQLSIMVGGDRNAFEEVRPLLDAIGPKLSYLGPNGTALLMKLAINLSLVVQGMSFCESVAMAEKAGIEREAAVDAVLKSVIASPMLGYRARMILDGGLPETPFADVALQQKDQELGLAVAQQLGAALPFASLANQYLTATRAAGLAGEEWIAVYQVFQRLAGIPAG